MSSTSRFPQTVLDRAQNVRAVIFDVDGVLTDGRIYIGERGEDFKAFNTLDGQGFNLLRRAGIEPVIITGRDAPCIRKRMRDLGIVHAIYGVHDKLAAAQQLLTPMQLQWHELAAMGDDWPDLPVLTRAALACVPLGSHAEVLARAHWVTNHPGGHGAARECVDLLLMACGKYHDFLQGYLA